MSRPVLNAPKVFIASEVLATAPVAALAVSLPAAIRLADEHVGLFEGWFAAAGLLCPLLALFIAAARGTRRAVRAMAQDRVVPLFVGAALWALAALPATALLGAVLKANTHHRALAGATFAVLALVVHLGAALVAWRIVSWVFARLRPASRPSHRTRVALVLVASMLVLLAATLTSAALAEDPSSPATSAAALPALLVDGALALVAAVVAAMFDVPADKRRDAAWLGAGVLVFVTAVGLGFAGRSPYLARSLTVRAPIAGTVAGAFGLLPGP